MKGHRAPVVQLAYSNAGQRSPGGRNASGYPSGNYLLASASKDGTVRLWTKAGKPIAQPIEHRRDVQSVLFDQNNQNLISASLDRDVQMYELPSVSDDSQALDQLLEEGCELMSDYLKANLNNVSNDQETASLMKQTSEFCEARSQ